MNEQTECLYHCNGECMHPKCEARGCVPPNRDCDFFVRALSYNALKERFLKMNRKVYEAGGSWKRKGRY